jgi:hypothetical protein
MSAESQRRHEVDWHQAFLYFASLPTGVRTYQAVADQYGVSVRTVERHGRNDDWHRQARQLDREAAQVAAERLRDKRADDLVDTEKLIDGSYVRYANQLVAGDVRVTPGDIVKLHGLRQQIWEMKETELAGRFDPEPAQVEPADPTQHKLEVLRALDDAGVLHQLLHPDRDGHDDDAHDHDGEADHGQVAGGPDREAL